LHSVSIELFYGYISADIFINYLQCSQIIHAEEQMFGLILVAAVKHFAQLDLIVQQPPQNFRAVVGIILLQHLIALYELPNFLVYFVYLLLRILK
jgi:hypothetical protein